MRDSSGPFPLQEFSLQDVKQTVDTPATSGQIIIIEEVLHHAPILARKLEAAGYDSLVQSSWEEPRPHPFSPLIVFLVCNEQSTLGEVWDTCRKIKHDTQAPVSVVVSETETLQRISGFSMGASDLVLELLNDHHIIQRVNDMVQGRDVTQRRMNIHRPKQYGCLVLEPDKHIVSVDDKTVPLTRSEYKILDFLVDSPGRVFHRQELVYVLYGKEHSVVERVVDVHIGNLRKKIELDPSRPVFIESVRGVGYRLKSID